jgi:hypothetical protein
MKNDSPADRRYTPEEISGWVRRYRAGCQSLGDFAAEHGLSRNRLHYWVYSRHPAPVPKPVGVAPVFQELKVTAGLPAPNWAVEISLATGAVARFTATATPAWIHSVLEGLCRPC